MTSKTCLSGHWYHNKGILHKFISNMIILQIVRGGKVS